MFLEALQAMEKELLACIRFLFVRISWIFRKCLNYFRSVVLALRLSGPPALPILGNVLTIKDSKALIDIGNNILKFNSPLCRTWMFFIPIILVFEPDHLKIILSNTKVSDKNFFYRIMHTFVGDGLITSTGDKWKKNRKLIQPCFQINLLENYVEDFVKVSEEVLNGLSGHGYVQITKVINTCVINILHRTVLGVNLQKEDETPFRRGELLILKRVLKPWLLLESVFKLSEMSKSESTQSTALHCYVKKILDDRLSQRKEKNIKNTCILDRLIDLSETSDFTEEDILNETVTFMLAGQDSVGAAVAFCLYQLAKHQDIQEKVYKEITEIIYGDHLKAVEVRQLSQMNYLEQCIKETMRLLPSIPLIARVLSADVTLGNYTLPTGTNIFISPFATHRLPHIFPDPLKFDPDRFSPENAKKIHPYGFLPFSIGPRNCIGYKFAYLEMKTIIASLVKNFHLALKPGHEDISLAYRVTLRAKGGIWLNIQPRNRTYAD